MNILSAIENIVRLNQYNIIDLYTGGNRINNVGVAFENYIKDSFAGSFELGQYERTERHSHIFSYLGNNNNPPDIMLNGGEAIEIKKRESSGSDIALNSSYPKAKLHSDSNMITNACRQCEDWDVKDIIYVIGKVNNNRIHNISMVYGATYIADKECYESLQTRIREGIYQTPNTEFAETNELARVNMVDPLGITYLRVRGMWGIQAPLRVFDYIYTLDAAREFNLMAIIPLEKYNQFVNRSYFESFARTNNASTNNTIMVLDKEVKNPNNPAQLDRIKLITYAV